MNRGFVPSVRRRAAIGAAFFFALSQLAPLSRADEWRLRRVIRFAPESTREAPREFQRMRLSKSGDWLACAYDDGVRICRINEADSTPQRLVVPSTPPFEPLYENGRSALAFSDDESALAFGQNGALVLWDLKKDLPIGRVDRGCFSLRDAVFSADRRAFIVGTKTIPQFVDRYSAKHIAAVRLVDLPREYTEDYARLGRFASPATTLVDGEQEWNVIDSLAISHDGKHLALASKRNLEQGAPSEVYVLNLAERSVTARREFLGYVADLAFSPHDGTLFVGARELSTWRWNGDNGGYIFPRKQGSVYSMSVSPNGDVIVATSYTNRSVLLWDATTKAPIARIVVPTVGGPCAVAIGPQQDVIIATHSGEVTHWDRVESEPESNDDSQPEE